MDFLNYKEKFVFNKDTGFALPQILIIGIGIAIGVTGIMATSILGLTGSRISRQELLAKSASFSGVTKLRALFNDNSQDRFLNYFWLVNNCSEKSNECEELNISLPTNEYWADDKWCNGEDNCRGRQKAPFCRSNSNFSWSQEKEIVRDLFIEDNFLGDALNDDVRKEFQQSFNIISSKYLGTENSGINSILIEGKSTPNNSDNESASNKLRVNIQISGNTSQSGFGFFSVGENQTDKEDSLFLGNIDIIPFDNAKGSIIWRMNIDDYENCINIKDFAKGANSSLPESGNGGIWIQPISLPSQPRLRNVIDIGNLICTKKNYEKSTSQCKLSADNSSQKTFRIYSLYVRGPDSKFEVSTTEDSKVILEIMGDIDVSNGGEFCHKNGSEDCGTGKPENLTILFKQKTKPQSNRLVCDRNGNEGGVVYKNNFPYLNITYPLDNNTLPGHSFLIDNTGDNNIKKFGAFIYGPQTTFISVRPKNNWVQITNEESGSNGGLVVTTRGGYGYIKNTLGNSIDDQITNLILNSDLRLISYGGAQSETSENISVIGVGEKVESIPFGSEFNPAIDKVFLLYNNSTSNYHLRSFQTVNINFLNGQNMQYSFPGSFAILNQKNGQNDVNLGTDLGENTIARLWLNSFNIKVKSINTNTFRNFTGAVWIKNLCFDSTGQKTWEFSGDFIDKLVSWHGNEFNWGIKYYRGKSIILWDTLRDFN